MNGPLRFRRRPAGPASPAGIEPAADTHELGLARTIATNMFEGIALIRAQDGVIVYTNPRWDSMFGYAHGELRGRHVSLVNAPTNETPEERAQEIMSALRRERSWRGTVHNVRKNGTHFWSEVGVSEFDHPDHGLVWIAVHRETTQRVAEDRNLRAAAERYRSVFDRSPAATILLTEDLRLADVNDAFCDLLGYPADHLLGKPLADVTRRDDAGLDHAFFLGVFGGDRPVFATRHYLAQGGGIVAADVEAVAVAGIDGRAPYAIATLSARRRGR